VLFIEIRVITPTSRGESYQDLILRLDSVVIELERTRKPVLMITHNAVLHSTISRPSMTPPPQPLVLSA
jgi:broad specificity phosphatase PhoE